MWQVDAALIERSREPDDRLVEQVMANLVRTGSLRSTTTTASAAYAEFAEKEKGSLEAGKLADFVLFDRDFSRVPVHSIRTAQVRMTVIGGQVRYEVSAP